MSLRRMDHVGVVVEDLDDGIAFFTALGMELEGRQPVEGDWVDAVNGIDGVQVEIAMMRTPDGHNKLELMTYQSPAPMAAEPHPAPVNAYGLRSVMFAVDDIADTIERLAPHGGELLGEVVDYQDIYRLCYLRGPGGTIVALAQELQAG